MKCIYTTNFTDFSLIHYDNAHTLRFNLFLHPQILTEWRDFKGKSNAKFSSNSTHCYF